MCLICFHQGGYMEGIGATPQPQISSFHDNANVEKSLELKTYEIGTSILRESESSSDLGISPRKLRFDEDVTHTQINGKVNEDGSYGVNVKVTILPLVDEPYGTVLSKEELKDLETTLQEIADKKVNNEETHEDSSSYVTASQGYIQRMEKLFDGRDSLPFTLAKPTKRNEFRTDKKLSSGYLTNTRGLSKIRKYQSVSWAQDQSLTETLEHLHKQVVNDYKKYMITAVSLDDLSKKMLEFRDFDKEITFTLDEIGDLYMDLSRTNNGVIPTALREAKTTEQKMKILLDYEEDIKDTLEKRLDLEFGEETLEAVYSEISKKDIEDYLMVKYPQINN